MRGTREVVVRFRRNRASDPRRTLAAHRDDVRRSPEALGAHFDPRPSFDPSAMFDAVRVDLERARASSNPSRLQSQLDRQSKLARKVRAQAAVASPHALLWKILAGFACVLLLSAVAHKSNGGRRGLDGASTLPYNALDGGDVGATWTTQRLCRHFGVPVPSRVRVEHGVDTLAKLDDATARWSEIHLVQLDVAYRAAGDDEKSARGWRAALARAPAGVPVVSASPYRASDLTLDAFLDAFARRVLALRQPVGREQGLMLTLKDPRAITHPLRALRDRVRAGRLPGPLVVGGEILPGPGGFLPQLASVFESPPAHETTHDHDESEHHAYVPPVPGDVSEASRAERERRTFPFSPSDLILAVKRDAPGAILHVGWSAHGGCADRATAAEARAAYEGWYHGEPFDWNWAAEAETKGDAPKLDEVVADAARRAEVVAAGLKSLKGLADALAKKSTGRKLAQEDSTTLAEEEDGAADSAADPSSSAADPSSSSADSDHHSHHHSHHHSPAAPTTSTSEETPAPPLTDASGAYDVNAAALRAETDGFVGDGGYTASMSSDAYWLLRNSTWRGDVWFDVVACLMVAPDSDGEVADATPLRRLVQQKLGYATRLNGELDENTAEFVRGEVKHVGAPDRSTTVVGMLTRDGAPVLAEEAMPPTGRPKGLAGEL